MNDYKKYQIVSFGQDRFAIADSSGKIIDDAQGYGYKTPQKAYLAANWKFKGGKEKKQQKENNYRQWLGSDQAHKDAVKKFDEYLEWNFKEIARGETTIDEIWNEIEKEFKIKIPDFVRKQAIK